MSNPKKKNQNYKNQAYFDHQRRQKRWSGKKKIQPTTQFSIAPLNITISPGLITTLLLLGMITASIADQIEPRQNTDTKDSNTKDSGLQGRNTTKVFNATSIPINTEPTTFTTTKPTIPPKRAAETTAKIITDLLNKKMQYNPTINDTKYIKACEQLKAKIVNTTKIIPSCADPIMRTLQHPNIGIFCLPQQEINSYAKTAENVGGFFIKEKNLMILSDGYGCDPTLISHEFTHADIHLLHNSQQCLSSPDNAIVPVYPANKETVDNYIRALDKGDRRMQEFTRIHLKQTDGEKLTTREKQLHSKYAQASQDCLLHRSIDTIPKTKYNELKTQQSRAPHNEIIIEKTGRSVKIIDLGYNNATKEYYAIEEMIDPSLSIILGHYITTDRVINNPIYRNQRAIIQLAERDAYTFAHLSKNARETFYKEAHKIRESFFERCSPKEASDTAPSGITPGVGY